VSEPKDFAGGIPAVVSSLKHVFGETSLPRGLQALGRLNQHGGFDCPSCAWPDPDGHRSFAEFCENGAKAVAEEATDARVAPAFFAEHPIAELAKQDEFWLGKRGRLTHPMYKPEGATHYQPISWDEAFGVIARELKALASPDEAVFYTSGRTSNEAAFLYQLFVRRFGTNNMPDCSNMCHESSGVALSRTLGIGKGTITLGDFELADAIFVVGQNPGTNHPRMLTALQAAARRGCKIVSVNPLPETGLKRFKHPQEVSGIIGPGTALEMLHVPVRINGDIPFFKGVMKAMTTDPAFIEQYTDGYEALKQDLEAARWEDLEEASGVSRALMHQAAAIANQADRVIATWAMGLTQHQNAVATIQEVVNFLLLRGQVGKPGAGACPVRGHSNVQGDRTMGITERPTEAFLDRLQATFNFPPPRTHGLDTVGAIQAMHAGRARVFFAMGGNFLWAAPDTAFTAEALSRCSLTVHVATKLNGSHVVTGRQALILPCLGRTELDLQASGAQLVSTENSMGVVQPSQGKLKPASEHLRSEPWIVTELARSVLGEDWSAYAADYDRIRDQIAAVVPGHEQYNQRLRQQGGFYLPNPPRDSRTFPTATGKARFTVNPVPRHELAPDQLMLMTIRSHDQFNTTIYGLDDRYRGISQERRVVFLNAEDARERSLDEASIVTLVSHFQGQRREAPAFRVVLYPLPRKCAAAYFPEANALVPVGSYAEGSRTPTSKSVVITLEHQRL
jgi:molybdopterin-dependent oxidoreductase alpha subunit